MKEYSRELSEAIEAGAVICHDGAKIDPSVHFILFEDDGDSFGPIVIGPRAIVRAGAIICSGVTIGENSMVGHQVVLRTRASIGRNCTVSHLTCIERDTKIGDNVRISALTHLTGGCLVEDDVQIGARVATVNDRQMQWHGTPNLKAPIFRKGCRVGSGVTVLGGTEIGRSSFVGAHSLVTKDVPPFAMVIGAPAYVHKWLRIDEAIASNSRQWT